MFVIAEPELGSKLRLRVYMERKYTDRAYQKLLSDLANRGDIPGFRKGKVPAWRVRRQYGDDVIDGAIYGDLLEQALRGALSYGDLHPTRPADFGEEDEERKAEEGRPVTIEAMLQVRPETRIPDWQGIELEAPDIEPTEEQIEEEVTGLQDAAADLVEVERTEVQKGDLVEIDLRTKVEGEEGEPEERQESLVVGEGRYDPALDEHIMGHSVGETVEFTVEYPDRPGMSDLAGMSVGMWADIKGLRERHVPEVDDEFAAKAIEGCSSADELRTEVASRVRARNSNLADTILRANAAKWMQENVRIDLPEELTKRSAEMAAESDEAAEGDADDAMSMVALAFACEALLEQEGVEVAEDEVRAEYMAMGAAQGLGAAALATDDMLPEIAGLLRDRIVRQKATDLIGQAATRKVVPMSELLGESDEEEPDASEGSEESTEESEDA